MTNNTMELKSDAVNNLESYLARPVQTAPVYDCEGRIVQGHKRIFNPITNHTYSIQSQSYTPVANIELLDHVTKARELGFELKSSHRRYTNAFRNEAKGARTYIEMVNPDLTIEVSKGDMVAPRIMIANSYDGSLAVRLFVGMFRFVCFNGMYTPVSGFNNLAYKHKHTAKVSIDGLTDSIEAIKASFPAQVDQYRALTGKILSYERGQQLIKEVLGERAVNDVSSLWVNGKGQDGTLSAYALNNGATEWLGGRSINTQTIELKAKQVFEATLKL